MMKKAITTVLFANFLNAQETIQLDRPDQTESVYVVPKNYLQTEMASCLKKQIEKIIIFIFPLFFGNMDSMTK